nr:hypothetical protein [Tanacetum cinerariifolium]
MVKTESEGMMKKDIEDMTISKYIEYEVETKRQTWRNTRSYFLTNKDPNSLSHDRRRVLSYEHHFDDSKINVYYDLSPLLLCFKPIQPYIKDRYEPLEVDIDFVSEDELETKLSPEEDLDGWLKAKMEKHMCGQDKESLKDALIDILKSLVDLGASVNVMPKLIFEHLKLASLKETNMVVEIDDMKKGPIRKSRKHPATIHAQIDVFKKEISLGIGEDRLKFDMDRGISNSRILVKKIYMASSVHEEENMTLWLLNGGGVGVGGSGGFYGGGGAWSGGSKGWGWRVRESGVEGRIDRETRILFGFAGKIPPEKFSGGGRVLTLGKHEKTNIQKGLMNTRKSLTMKNKNVLRVGRKRYAMDDVWEKCEKFHDTAYPWHDEGFAKEEQWESGIENTDYKPSFVKSETLEVKQYFFKNGKSFVCITKQLDDALPLGRVNGSRFMGMIRKEMDEEGRIIRKT